jgi:hypothetical protein
MKELIEIAIPELPVETKASTLCLSGLHTTKGARIY